MQTSKNYIQKTKPNDDLSYTNSLKTDLNLEGFGLRKNDDQLKINLSFYQTNQEDEDNKTVPIVLPNIQYHSGYYNKFGNIYDHSLEFYNILRDKSTDVHSKRQQKISHKYKINKKFINFNSKISMDAEIYNQIFNTDQKKVSTNNYKTGTYYRFFPIVGISSETPFKIKNFNSDLTFSPKINLTLSPGISNSNKLSNEDSTNNDFSIENIYRLNRFSGNDKLDNSKRVSYGVSAYTQNFNSSLMQSYEFTKNSNFHNEQGNDHYLSDLLGSIEYKDKTEILYNFRYDVNNNYLKTQNINFLKDTDYGELNIAYLDQNTKVNNIISKDTETINYSFSSKKFSKFSKIYFNGLYDMKKEINKEYSLGYSYFDECFGINIDFNRKSYEEDSLKPQDILTIMFSFKNIGSYKSTNILAVTEGDRRDIEWESYSVDDDQFEKY